MKKTNKHNHNLWHTTKDRRITRGGKETDGEIGRGSNLKNKKKGRSGMDRGSKCKDRYRQQRNSRRQGSVLGAVIRANLMDSLKETADQGRATTNVRKAKLGPLCFQDDGTALSNKKIDAI